MTPHDATVSPAYTRSTLSVMIWTEIRMGLRARMFRVAAGLIFLLGWSSGSVGGHGVGMSAYTTGDVACQYLGVIVAFWVALGALRDTTMHVDVLIFTKPQPPERLGLARFFGLFGQILCFLVALFLGAIVGRWFAEGNLIGFPAYGIQYLRAMGVLFFTAAASYCLALIGESPIAGAIVGVYLVVAMAGREFLAKSYFPWYTQNIPFYVLFGITLLGFSLWFSRRRLRGGSRVATWIPIVTPLSLALAVWSMSTTIRNGHDPMTVENPGLMRMSEQTLQPNERVPGFLLPNQQGKPTNLSQFQGKILVIALWSPRDVDSTLLLARLERLRQKYGDRGVQPVAICMSEDSGAAPTFAYGENLAFPVVYDWGTHNSSRTMEASPLAIAYRAEKLPVVVITDRRHRLRSQVSGLLTYEGVQLDKVITERLEEEPE